MKRLVKVLGVTIQRIVVVMRNLDLNIQGVKDTVARENFDQIQEEVLKHPLLKFDGKHVELTFTKDLANHKYKHNLGYRPRDVIVTSLIGTGTVTWNYSLFDNQEIDLTIAGTILNSTLVIRAFIGTYLEQ